MKWRPQRDLNPPIPRPTPAQSALPDSATRMASNTRAESSKGPIALFANMWVTMTKSCAG